LDFLRICKQENCDNHDGILSAAYQSLTQKEKTKQTLCLHVCWLLRAKLSYLSIWKTSKMLPINIPKKIGEYDDNRLKDYIKIESFKKYKQESKPLQVNTVANLVRGQNTFLLAAIGFGKSRIPEMYLNLTTRDRNGKFLGVVVVLNPLDALGDNQVEEKITAGYTAINLTQLNFSQQTAGGVKNGVYNFVYLSPKIFLNNKAFEKMYLTPIFQQKLVFVVVDEAHMIYSWGLVESGKRHLKTLVRHQDQCAFCPCYGNIGAALLNKNNAPILLMSATCRPKAIDVIKLNLKLVKTDLGIIKGKLSQPEIRIIQITMNNSLSTCLDLLRMYPSEKQTPKNQLVPTLIYSGTRHATLKVLEVLDIARKTPGHHFIAGSDFARQYHLRGRQGASNFLYPGPWNGPELEVCSTGGSHWTR
jgi:superfamily II DNA helicase RecQ